MGELDLKELRRLCERADAACSGGLPFPDNMEALHAVEKIFDERLVLALLDRLEAAEEKLSQVWEWASYVNVGPAGLVELRAILGEDSDAQ